MTNKEVHGEEQLRIKAEIESNNKKARAKLKLPFAERLVEELKK